MVISVIGTRTPRKTIEVAGDESFQERYTIQGNARDHPRPGKQQPI